MPCSDRPQLPLAAAPLPAVRCGAGCPVVRLPLHRPRRVPRAGVRRSVPPAVDLERLTHRPVVTHATEVPYVYGTCDPASQACQMMIDYWVSFATSLDPNDQKGVSRPQWPAYAQTAPVRCGDYMPCRDADHGASDGTPAERDEHDQCPRHIPCGAARVHQQECTGVAPAVPRGQVMLAQGGLWTFSYSSIHRTSIIT
jgi:hypothetical protein